MKVKLTGKLLRVAVVFRQCYKFLFQLGQSNKYSSISRKIFISFCIKVLVFNCLVEHVVQDPDMLQGGRLLLHADLTPSRLSDINVVIVPVVLLKVL